MEALIAKSMAQARGPDGVPKLPGQASNDTKSKLDKLNLGGKKVITDEENL